MAASNRKFHISAVCKEERSQAISRCQEAVANNNGHILDFKMFSNLSITLMIEVMEADVLALVSQLKTFQWNVKHEIECGPHSNPIEGTIQITFPDGDGELKILVPSVPG